MKDNAKKALTAAYGQKDAWEEEEWDAQAALILQPYRTKIVHGGKRDSHMPGGTPPQGSAAAIAPGEASAQAKRPLCCRSAGAGAKRKKPCVSAAKASMGTPAEVVAPVTQRRWRSLTPVGASPMDMLRDAFRPAPL